MLASIQLASTDSRTKPPHKVFKSNPSSSLTNKEKLSVKIQTEDSFNPSMMHNNSTITKTFTFKPQKKDPKKSIIPLSNKYPKILPKTKILIKDTSTL